MYEITVADINNVLKSVANNSSSIDLQQAKQWLVDYANGEAKLEDSDDAYTGFGRLLGLMESIVPEDASKAEEVFVQDVNARVGNMSENNEENNRTVDEDQNNNADQGNEQDNTNQDSNANQNESVQPQQRTVLLRARSENADAVELRFSKTVLDVYHDMKLVSNKDYKVVQASNSVKDIDEFLATVKRLTPAQELDFAERFVKSQIRTQNSIEDVPPVILAKAYESLRTKSAAGRASAQDVALTDLVKNRIDDLANQFALFRGNNVVPTVGQQKVFNFVDMTNIADSYDGYKKMFETRLADFPNGSTDNFVSVLQNNIRNAQGVMDAYDSAWGLDAINKNNAGKVASSLNKNWNGLNKRLDAVRIPNSVLEICSHYQFLDANGAPIPQFVDVNNIPVLNFVSGAKLDSNGRLAQIINLAKQDIAMQNVASQNNISDADLARSLVDRIGLKLFEIDTASKTIHGALEEPDQFVNPAKRQQFLADLAQNVGAILDSDYNAVLEGQVNQTAGFAARLNSKLGNESAKTGTFFNNVFKPIENIDKRGTKARLQQNDKVKTRIEFFKRILKGFASAFLVSAAITAIATAAAATAGISLAASIATIGVITAIATSFVRIQKWKKAREANGLSAGIKDLLSDKRMLASLGTTTLAVAAMCFGVAGLGAAAAALGYGALAVGGTTNAVQMFNDARAANMSNTEAVVWAVANAAAVLAGGITGRMATNYAINEFNSANPENTTFQKEEHSQRTDHITHEETHTQYTQEALDNAERISKMWYQNNPTELQHRVDLINQYNLEHGTNIDPYRAIMINGDAGGQTFDNMNLLADDAGNVMQSHGNHRLFGVDWLRDNPDFTRDDIIQARNLFNPDGTINNDAMDVISRLDLAVNADNSVGAVTQGDNPLHNAPGLKMNAVGPNGEPVYNTYATGPSVFETTTINTTEDVITDTTNYTPVDVSHAAGMFGIYYEDVKQKLKRLRNRLGSFMDNLFGKKEEPKPEDEEKPEPKPEDKEDEEDIKKPEPKPEDEDDELEDIKEPEPKPEDKEDEEDIKKLEPELKDEQKPEQQQEQEHFGHGADEPGFEFEEEENAWPEDDRLKSGVKNDEPKDETGDKEDIKDDDNENNNKGENKMIRPRNYRWLEERAKRTHRGIHKDVEEHKDEVVDPRDGLYGDIDDTEYWQEKPMPKRPEVREGKANRRPRNYRWLLEKARRVYNKHEFFDDDVAIKDSKKDAFQQASGRTMLNLANALKTEQAKLDELKGVYAYMQKNQDSNPYFKVALTDLDRQIADTKAVISYMEKQVNR